MSVRITLKAYLKILLHCHKYPYRAINGVLIGKAKQKEALDCIPLFHQSLQLSPMIEMALLQVQQMITLIKCWLPKIRIFGCVFLPIAVLMQ